jgi:hypothetical protein
MAFLVVVDEIFLKGSLQGRLSEENQLGEQASHSRGKARHMQRNM